METSPVKSTLCIYVNTAPGAEIDATCRDLCVLADRLNIRVETVFRGVLLSASPGDRWEEIVDNWKPALIP